MDSSVTFRFPVLGARNKAVERATHSAAVAAPSAATSDEALMLQVCQGSREALAALFRKYATLVRGLGYRVVQDPSEADDLLQDTFLLIDRKSRLFDPARGTARSWILQVAYRNALARRRHLKACHFYTRLDLEHADNTMMGAVSFPEGREEASALLRTSGLSRAFESLSRDQRETLRLFFVEGHTLPEIATKLHQTHGNVKHHYFRGLEKLRKHVFKGKLRGNSAV